MKSQIKTMNEEELRALLEDCQTGCLDHSGRPCQQDCTGLDGECCAFIPPRLAAEWASLAEARLAEMRA